MSSRKSNIATAIKTRLATISQLKSIETVNIRVKLDDIQDHEVPFMQFFDGGETIRHEKFIAVKTWRIFLELVMKSTSSAAITQLDIWNLQNVVETTLFQSPTNLGITGMQGLKYVGNNTDLHLVDPVFTIIFEILAIYDDPLVTC